MFALTVGVQSNGIWRFIIHIKHYRVGLVYLLAGPPIMEGYTMNIAVKQYSISYNVPVVLGGREKASQAMAECKRLYGHNWAYHFHQWKLWNTSAGKKAFNNYTKGL